MFFLKHGKMLPQWSILKSFASRCSFMSLQSEMSLNFSFPLSILLIKNQGTKNLACSGCTSRTAPISKYSFNTLSGYKISATGLSLGIQGRSGGCDTGHADCTPSWISFWTSGVAFARHHSVLDLNLR